MASPDSLFATATEWLSQHGVGAVDWNALAAKRQDSVRNTQYMDQYLLPAFQRAAATIDSIQLQREPPDEVLSVYAALTNEVKSVGDKAFEILKANFQFTKAMLFPQAGAAFGVEADLFLYSTFLYHLWSSALTGANAHITGRIHLSGLSDQEIAYHASLTTMCLNVFPWLDRLSLLAPLKKGSTNGLGAVPLAAIIVLGAVLIGVIAWGIIAIYQLSLRQKIVEQVCSKAIESGDPAQSKRCDDLLNNPEANLAAQIPKIGGEILEKVAIAAMVGAGVYMLVLFGPGIAVKLKQTVAAYKTS